MCWGFNQDAPFHLSALPVPSTAQQLLVEEHETESRPPPFGSMDWGCDQDAPFQLSALPL
jgi:hypothetical protein